MKLNKLIAFAGAMMATATLSNAAAHVWEDPSGWWTGHWTMERGTAVRYTSQELSMDLFGSYSAGERGIEHLFETNIRHGEWGGGVGLNYFITREIGIGIDANAGDNRGAFVDDVLGSLILRWPFGNSGFAPYIFGGGGRGIDPVYEWVGHAGLGMEYRFNPATGIFVDGRYIWADKSFDRLLLRAGVRIVF